MNETHPEVDPNDADLPVEPDAVLPADTEVAQPENTDGSVAAPPPNAEVATEQPSAPAIDTPESLREYALAEARKGVARGWAYTQLDGKVPKRKGWQKAPKPTLELVEQWILASNVGLRTGEVSGVVIVDDDSEDGSASASLGLPPTVTVITGSGKLHLYFKHPGFKCGNSTGNLPDHIDVRGDGGQVVAVGSIHPKTNRAYRWALGLSPDEVEIADLPANVIELIHAPKAKKKKAKNSVTRREKKRPSVSISESAGKALADCATAVATAVEGARNETLNREAFRMGRWINSGSVARADVEAALTIAAQTCGLGEQEIVATLHSGLNSGCSQLVHFDGPSGFPAAPKVKASITIEGGKLPELVTAAENALIKAQVPVFQRGGSIVRTIRAPAMTLRDIYRRAEGVLMLTPIEAPHLVEVFTRVANWYAYNREELVVIDCPERIARTYLARVGQWRVRRLLGVVEAPTLRPDGSVIETPGYDQQTCLWFDPGGVTFPKIPSDPTREDALKALALLLQVIKDFPFVAESDRSAALAAILTALVRHSLRTAPLHAFRAPKMGSGKSLLADIVALIATGRVCSVMSQGKDEDEDKKRLLAILIEGVSVACVDNIERSFGSAALCTILTQEVWRDRILGTTATATVPTTVTWLATGNNITFVGDIVTRVVPCDLDANVENPEERRFQVNLHEYIPANRGALVTAGLTILRAFRVAGSPDQGLSVFGRFEEWSDWVRSALVWLGCADPNVGRARLYSQDPVGSRLRVLLAAWHARVGERPISAAELIALASNCVQDSVAGGVVIDMAAGTESSTLYTALVEVATGQGGRPDGRRLGNYLSKYERRAEGGLRVERFEERQGVVLWRVVPVDGQRSVGFVGLVGHCPEIHETDENSNTNAETSSETVSESQTEPGEDVEGHSNTQRANDAAQRPTPENNPRNPRNPPSDGDRERSDGTDEVVTASGMRDWRVESGRQNEAFTEDPDAPMDPEPRSSRSRRNGGAS